MYVLYVGIISSVYFVTCIEYQGMKIHDIYIYPLP